LSGKRHKRSLEQKLTLSLRSGGVIGTIFVRHGRLDATVRGGSVCCRGVGRFQ